MRGLVIPVLALILLFPFNASARPEKAGQAPADRFAAMDADQNGHISKEEFFKTQPNMKEAAFAAIDKDGDGAISAEEWNGFAMGHGREGVAMPPHAHPAGEACPAEAPDLIMPPSGK